jgi:hypothetical protein
MNTLTQQNKTVSDAKAEFGRAKDRLTRALDTTPDERINWSPSETSRTPIQQVAHAAIAIEGIQGMLMGKPFPFSGPAEMDAVSRQMEKGYTTRESAVSLLNEKSDAYLNFLDTLSDEQVDSTFESPFGAFPMASAITFAADHTRNHAGQIEYTQTIYGDQDWHIPA